MMAGGITVKSESVQPFLSRLFSRAGLPVDHAETMAENLYEAELRGVYSHGLSLVKGYAGNIASGTVNRNPDIKTLRESASTLLIDGDFAPGSTLGGYAMRRCLEKAAETGFASASVKRACHFGMAAFYSMMALERDMIGIALCTSGVNMAVYGGSTRVLGTNPISVAVPAGERLPIVYDGATSHAAFGKIFAASRNGETIPEGWALSDDGKATTNAAEAVRGMMIPFGDYKGSGLAVIVSVLSAVLSGADAFTGYAAGKQDSGAGEGIGFFFAALDIAKLRDVGVFKRDIDTLIDGLKSSRKRPGFGDEIYMPGELEFRRREQNLKNGITISKQLFEELGQTAAEFGVNEGLKRA